MSPKDASNAPTSSSMTKQNITYLSNKLMTKRLSKSLVLSGLFLFLFYALLSSHFCCKPSTLLTIKSMQFKWFSSSNNGEPTNLSHVVFGIAGSSNTWAKKRWYIESWWQPNMTKGYLFLDRSPVEHLPWPPTSPPFRVSKDNSRYHAYNKHKMPFAIRMVRVIEETFKAENGSSVRWYVMADDDTVLILENLVEVLARYDYTNHFYIGMNSECVISNFDNSFEMAFGGAGYALSYPLAKAVAENMELCIKRYPTLFGSDHILQSCIADLGVSLTHEKGFHQIDLHSDISGFLSAHPQSPFLSLHHLDVVDPIFPSMNRQEALNHLMKAAKADASRLLQQSICYHNQNNWTFSVSWGYSIHIYENIIPPSVLHRPIETFIQWRRGGRPPFMFNSRRLSADPCEAPHVFFFDSVSGSKAADHVVTSYARKAPRGLPSCWLSGNHSADGVSRVEVLSPMTKLLVRNGNRRECCDFLQHVGMDSVEVKLRTCTKDEIIA